MICNKMTTPLINHIMDMYLFNEKDSEVLCSNNYIGTYPSEEAFICDYLKGGRALSPSLREHHIEAMQYDVVHYIHLNNEVHVLMQ